MTKNIYSHLLERWLFGLVHAGFTCTEISIIPLVVVVVLFIACLLFAAAVVFLLPKYIMYEERKNQL